MKKDGKFHSTFNLETLFITVLALLALYIDSTSAVSHAISVTPSPGSVVPSPTIHSALRSSWFHNRNKTVSFTTIIAIPSPTPLPVRSTISWRNKNTLTHKTTLLPSTTRVNVHSVTSVTPSQDRVTTPTSPATVGGLPNKTVIAAIAAVLGGILLILTGIIVWNLCITDLFRGRPLARVQPATRESVAGSVDQLL